VQAVGSAPTRPASAETVLLEIGVVGDGGERAGGRGDRVGKDKRRRDQTDANSAEHNFDDAEDHIVDGSEDKLSLHKLEHALEHSPVHPLAFVAFGRRFELMLIR
jgi:hypothetical protein